MDVLNNLENSNLKENNKNDVNIPDEIYVIDRFEENIAVLENRTTQEIKNVPISVLPKDLKEGSVLKCIDGKYIVYNEQAEEIENRIKNKMDEIWND